jgi:hypothetical protein
MYGSVIFPVTYRMLKKCDQFKDGKRSKQGIAQKGKDSKPHTANYTSKHPTLEGLKLDE